MASPSIANNLKILECFRSIIDTGSATAAAERLGMTQPGVSRLLKMLEVGLGFNLFHRRQGRLVPTAEALVLYQEVDVALQSVDRVAQLAANLKNADYGDLSIVAPPSLAEGILSQVLAGFVADHPHVRISLDSHPEEQARELVTLRAADCGFIKLPAEFPNIATRKLVRSGTVCALPSGHRLAERQIIRVHDLKHEPLVLLGKGKASRTQLEEAFRKAGIRMNVRVETHTVGAACAIARQGVGIAIVNEMLAMQFAGRGLKLQRLSPNLPHEYGFMTASNVPMNRVTERFMESCERYFERKKHHFLLS